MGGQRGEDPLENVSIPFLFFLSGTAEGDKHVSGPRLSLSSSESHPSRSSSPGRASSSGRKALYGPFSDPGEPLLGPYQIPIDDLCAPCRRRVNFFPTQARTMWSVTMNRRDKSGPHDGSTAVHQRMIGHFGAFVRRRPGLGGLQQGRQRHLCLQPIVVCQRLSDLL